ncbi:MAG: HAD family hydrolase [Lachnospiraceae bacterium]|nr:HAD family hydrolase [Lachnospiraceae bacterium]
MPDMVNLKYIFFDMGYTLADESLAWEKRCAEQAQTAQARALGLTAEDIYNEIAAASRAYLPQFRTVVEKFHFSEAAPYRREFEALYEDAAYILERLSARYRLGVIANQSAGLSERLEEYGIRQYFDVVVSSWEHRCMKPDRRLFEIALEEAGCRAPQAVMVGDRLDNDIFPAKALGMKTIWVRQGFGGMQEPRSAEYEADYVTETLRGVLEVLLPAGAEAK